MFAYRSMLREQARPSVIRESRRAPWLTVSVVCFGAFMGQLDASVVTITFPAMQHDFGVPVAAVQWVSLVYLLGLVAMLAPAGRLGDAPWPVRCAASPIRPPPWWAARSAWPGG
jgi:MFS family permease